MCVYSDCCLWNHFSVLLWMLSSLWSVPLFLYFIQMAAINPAFLRETFQVLLLPASDKTHFSTFPLDFSPSADSPPNYWAMCFLFSTSPSTGTSTSGLYQRLLSLIHPFPHFQQCPFAHSCVSWIFLSFLNAPWANSSPFPPGPHTLLSSIHNSHPVP